MTMSYILIVHPLIMKNAGMPMKEVFTVTALMSAIFTLFMGLYAKLPFALAPAMGSNAFLAMTLVGSGAVTWHTKARFSNELCIRYNICFNVYIWN